MASYTDTTLDITADDRIFTPRGVGALDIGIIRCLSELVANSLDWRRFTQEEIDELEKEIKTNPKEMAPFIKTYGHLLKAKPVEPEIYIRFDGESVEIWDNGIGMTLKELEVGLQLRGADDVKRFPLRRRKGMFGMGMKVGILGMGWKFSIRTRSVSENTENALEIDTREIEKGNIKLNQVEARVYKEHDKAGPLGDYESGTYIRVTDLHKKSHEPPIWREEIGLNFSPEIQYDQIKIIVIDARHGKENPLAPCTPKIEEIFEDTKVQLDDRKLMVAQDHGDGTRGKPIQITGWLALRKTGGTGKGRWGLHTFRKGQLVEAYHNKGPDDNGLLPSNPHPMLARVHGEVHLDMCDPNFTKVGWNTELKSWEDVQEKLRPFLEELIRASRASYRKGGASRSRKSIQRLQEMARSTVEKLSEVEGGEVPTEDSKDTVLIGKGDFLKISINQQPIADPDRFWYYFYRKKSNEMVVFINTESSLWNWTQKGRYDDRPIQLLINWAIVDSLYFCLTHDKGMDTSSAVDLRDSWHAKLYAGD